MSTDRNPEIHEHVDAANAALHRTVLMRRLRLYPAAANAACKATVHLTLALSLVTLENAELRARLKKAGVEDPKPAPPKPGNFDTLAADLAANLGKTKETPK